MRDFPLVDVVYWPRKWVCVTCEGLVGLGQRRSVPDLLLEGDRRQHRLAFGTHVIECRSTMPA